MARIVEAMPEDRRATSLQRSWFPGPISHGTDTNGPGRIHGFEQKGAKVTKKRTAAETRG